MRFDAQSLRKLKFLCVVIGLASAACTSDTPVPLRAEHERCMSHYLPAAIRAEACEILIHAPPDEGRIMSAIHHYRAVALAEMGQLDLAIIHYDASIRIKPSDANVYYNRGHAYFKNRNFEKAFEDYSEAIRLNHNHYQAYNNRAALFVKRRQIKEAISDYSHSLRVKPDHYPALTGRASAYLTTRQFRRAVVDYEKIKKLRPNEILGHQGQALGWWGMGDRLRALGTLENALKLEPTNKNLRKLQRNLRQEIRERSAR